MFRSRYRVFLLLPLLLGCGKAAPSGSEAVAPERGRELGQSTAVEPSLPPVAAKSSDAGVRVVFLGDSLTAGFGLGEAEAFPARVGEEMARLGWKIEVVNAGVSGDTTAGGLERLDWLLRQQPAVVVVGLGANDGLRGLPLAATDQNLRQIVRRTRGAGVGTLLLGMRIPPSYGTEYVEAFAAIYPRLASDLEVELVPFLLEGVGGEEALNQADGIHPNAEGQRRAAANVIPHLQTVLSNRNQSLP